MVFKGSHFTKPGIRHAVVDAYCICERDIGLELCEAWACVAPGIWVRFDPLLCILEVFEVWAHDVLDWACSKGTLGPVKQW